LLLSNTQLAGGSAVMASQTAAESTRMSVAQLGSLLTDWFEAAAWSLTQAEYCATVAVHVEGIPSQAAEPGEDCRQSVSWLVQFCLMMSSEGKLVVSV
jgi:hypothetical protein